jgi:photosystem II stability/assembly factor-like uncharacterized protein
MKKMKKCLLTIYFIISISIITNAQWELACGPYGGNINCLIQNKVTNTIFAGTGMGLFRYKSSLNRWESLAEKNAEFSNSIDNIEASGSLIYFTVYGGLIKSADDGETWTTVLIDTNVQYVQIKYCDDNLMIVQSDNGIYLSANNGTSFTHVSWNIDISSIINFIMVGNRMLLIGYSGGHDKIYYSDDFGQTWSYSMTILKYGASWPTRFRIFNSNVYLVDEDNIYVSTNNGETWQILPVSGIQYPTFTDIYVSNNTIIISTQCYNAILVSNDYGQTYSQIYNGFPLQKVCCNQLLNTSTYGLLAATNFGIFKTNNLGSSWNDFNFNLSSIIFSGFTQCNNELFVTSDYTQGVFSTIDGLHWSRKSQGLELLTQFDDIMDIITVDKRLIVSTGNGLPTFYSDNYGLNWHKSGPIPGAQGRLEYANGKVYNCTTQGLFISSDTGKTWHHLTSEPPYDIFDIKVKDNWMVFSDLYFNWSTGTSISAIKRSVDYGNTLSTVNTPFVFTQVEMIDSLLIANAKYLISSTDKGLTWFADSTWGANNISNIYVTNNNDIIIGTKDEKVYYSTNKTISWIDLTDNFQGIPRSINLFGNYLYVASSKYGIWRRNIANILEASDKPYIIYPNPTTDYITIDNPDLINGLVVSIFNIQGQLVLKQSLVGIKPSIYIGDFANGLYIVQLTNSDNSSITKIVKE